MNNKRKIAIVPGNSQETGEALVRACGDRPIGGSLKSNHVKI